MNESEQERQLSESGDIEHHSRTRTISTEWSDLDAQAEVSLYFWNTIESYLVSESHHIQTTTNKPPMSNVRRPSLHQFDYPFAEDTPSFPAELLPLNSVSTSTSLSQSPSGNTSEADSASPVSHSTRVRRRRSSLGLVRGIDLDVPVVSPGIWVDFPLSPQTLPFGARSQFVALNNSQMLPQSVVMNQPQSNTQVPLNMANQMAIMQQQQRMLIQQQSLQKSGSSFGGPTAVSPTSKSPHMAQLPNTPQLIRPINNTTLHASPAFGNMASMHMHQIPGSQIPINGQFQFPTQALPQTQQQQPQINKPINTPQLRSHSTIQIQNSNNESAQVWATPSYPLSSHSPAMEPTPAAATPLVSMNDVVPIQVSHPVRLRTTRSTASPLTPTAISQPMSKLKRKQPASLLVLSPTPELEKSEPVDPLDYESSSEDGSSSLLASPATFRSTASINKRQNTGLTPPHQHAQLKSTSVPTKLSTVSTPPISEFPYTKLPPRVRIQILSHLTAPQLAKFRLLDRLASTSPLWSTHLQTLYPQLHKTLTLLTVTTLPQLIDVLRPQNPTDFHEQRLTFWTNTIQTYIALTSKPAPRSRTPSPTRISGKEKPFVYPQGLNSPEQIAYAILETGKKVMNGLRCGNCKCRPRVRDSVWCVKCGSFGCGPKNFSKKCVYSGREFTELPGKSGGSGGVQGLPGCVHWSDEACYSCNTQTAGKCRGCNAFYCVECSDGTGEGVCKACSAKKK
ncbi:hypothetical protein HDU79_007760 [Rhizoclosmatium sp. JEL0117]|nr:hypothetical protein HDU79_007760 [Rhizoclosmatium sp. JEL0117]